MHMLIMLVTQDLEFKTSLAYVAKPHFKKKKVINIVVGFL